MQIPSNADTANQGWRLQKHQGQGYMPVAVTALVAIRDKLQRVTEILVQKETNSEEYKSVRNEYRLYE